jgi:superfamily II DNA or RNA helicase
LRFLLADDPGAGKTIMAGLFMKELQARGDLRRCLIVCPGSLAEQWQDELSRRFALPFEIVTRSTIEESRSGNPFLEKHLIIARLDHLSRNDDVQAKLEQSDWDLVVCDEAHKMSATYFSGDAKETRRYKLGRLLGGLTRHFLLMTATPHNGKEADFQLFLKLLDADRFEGKYREGEHQTDTSDLMRRMIKEKLLTFDGTPLFPERIASTVTYRLSEAEAKLYAAVTDYVREEMNRADTLAAEGEGRRSVVVGFALTTLQRRLASSPEAIYRSLERRRKRLENRLNEEQVVKRGHEVRLTLGDELPTLSAEDVAELDDDAPAAEREKLEELFVDQASAARTIAELRAEIALLRQLEALAFEVRRLGTDRKWEELSRLLQDDASMFDAAGRRRKLIVFTEHLDTLRYLRERITNLLGREESVVVIHGGMGREERRKAQELFTQDKDVHVLLATDAAGEGVNLQRAHLMVNYDLPWNPNRIEQRFGRIHRIGQTEVCHLWNLVAEETREGEVYKRLLEKLEVERAALGGQVFDVLGQVFSGDPLRELLWQAVRYGERPDVRQRLFEQIDAALDRDHLRELLDDYSLADTTLDTRRIAHIREEMERAEARRLQPHFIEAFFRRAFAALGGQMREREPNRFEITHVPAVIRARDRQIGTAEPVLQRYERVTFEKDHISVPGQPLAAFICPGHPLLDATIDLVLERYRGLFKRGATLVDPDPHADGVRVLVCLEHEVQDGRLNRDGSRRVISKRLQFVEIDAAGEVRDAGPAPYLDYRPITAEERERADAELRQPWLAASDLEAQAAAYAVERLGREHLAEVRGRKERLVERTAAAVKERLTKEINFWDHRANQLREREAAGRTSTGRLNAEMASRRADDLQSRLQTRLAELEQERRVSARPPLVVGGALVVPARLIAPAGQAGDDAERDPARLQEIDRLAMAAVLEAERRLGHEPRSMPHNHPGYDIESREANGRLRFIEVKGKAAGQRTVTVSKTQVLYGLNVPEQFVLAIVPINGAAAAAPRYVRRPFHVEPDWGAVSVNYDLEELLARSEEPG